MINKLIIIVLNLHTDNDLLINIILFETKIIIYDQKRKNTH